MHKDCKSCCAIPYLSGKSYSIKWSLHTWRENKRMNSRGQADRDPREAAGPGAGADVECAAVRPAGRCEEGRERHPEPRALRGWGWRRAGGGYSGRGSCENQGTQEDRSDGATREGTGPGARVGSGGTRLGSQESDLKTGFWKQNPQNRSVS